MSVGFNSPHPASHCGDLMSVGWARYAFKFGEYYKNCKIDEMWYPPRLRTREWMFDGFDDRPPERHRGFRKPDELLAHVNRKIPKSCFYSTAYYRDPNQRLMKEKGLQGSDLIFDLDGDHLPGVTDGDFPAMIHVIQEQAHQLWTDFLEPEFGFEEKFLQVTFSGHRGFHLHYRSPDIWELDSQARREIVAHIKGEGADVSTIIQGPDSDWKRRIISGVDAVLNKLDLAHNGNRQVLKELKGIIDSRRSGVGEKRLLTLAEKAQNQGRRERLVEGYTSGKLSSQFGDNLDKIFNDLVIGDKAVVLGNAGETDEVVTIDLKRVIRWPTSLHGKSGMKVVELPVNRLDPNAANAFDPLTEAVPWKMGSPDIKVRAIKSDVRYRIGSCEGQLDEGEIYSVDEATATFLVLKNWAQPAQ